MLIIGMSSDEFFFRMSQLLEHCKMSTNAALSSAVQHVSRFRQQHLGGDNHHALLHSLQTTAHQLADFIRQRLQHLPFADRCHAAAQRAVRWVYAKCLPVLARLSENSLLAATAGFVLGLAMRHLWGCRHKPLLKVLKMRGIVCQSHDALSGLFGLVTLRSDLDRPRITSSDQVLIRVRLTSIDELDLDILRGERKRHFEAAKHVVLGRDLVGEVEEVGVDVDSLSVGDRVWTARDLSMPGTMSEYVVFPACQVRPLPSARRLDEVGAATLPYSGLTVLRALHRLQALLKPYACAGIRVFVSDGASAAGCVAIQVLHAWGAEVTACVPHRLVPLAKVLGTKFVIALDMPDAEEHCAAELLACPLFDAAVVSGGLLSVEFCRRHAKEVAVVGDLLEEQKQSFFFFFCRWNWGGLNYDDLDRLSELVESGDLKPVLDAVFALEDFREAFNHVASVGKTVVKFCS